MAHGEAQGEMKGEQANGEVIQYSSNYLGT
jgi:hypothetical protein